MSVEAEVVISIVKVVCVCLCLCACDHRCVKKREAARRCSNGVEKMESHGVEWGKGGRTKQRIEPFACKHN